jgi:uncharacterized protein YigE (DUF2233 family)
MTDSTSRLLSPLLFALAVFGSGSSLAVEAPPAAPCRPLVFANGNYLVCDIDLRRYEVRIFWRGKSGKPFGAIANLVRALDPADSSRFILAMNAGMYEQDLSPVGLLVEQGRQVAPANTARGTGNVYWKPNGVFFVGEGQAGVLETGLYLQRRPHTDYATQSGPLLVVNGRIESRMLASTASRNIRNGVGVRDAHTAVFVISDDPVSFSDFARLFRDALSCPNALYFDGSISDLSVPALHRADHNRTAGPLVAVFARP